MFLNFFYELKKAKVPVSLKEWLMLIEALEAGCANYSVDDFYYLSRSALVKDERNLDKFDKVFGTVFKGFEPSEDGVAAEIPEEWLKKLTELFLTEEEKKKLQSLGGWEKIIEEFKKRLAEQKKRHQGGSKWIGTAGTSPFGAYGFNPEGIRIGQESGRQRRAVKVWDKREYQNLDDGVILGTRNIKLALRRLRKFAREGAEEELDLDGTVESTAKNGGYIDIRMQPERRNTVKVLALFDVGGSMDDHIRTCAELFSAARAEFKHIEHYYFHNCLYEKVWKDNRRRHSEVIPTWQVLHTYPPDWKVIFVGDASMSPYEIVYPGGSVEHWNEEPGQAWMTRVLDHFKHSVWLNPVPERHWEYTPSLTMMRQVMADRMYPLTLDGLDRAMRELNR
jgi:uncharacterized protein with von Willebrand factor type A (vWA) domain